jgi:hypothetical protein
MNKNRRIPVIITPILTLLVALLLVCGAGGVAVKQGFIEPPTINLTIDGVGLVAKITDVPSCPVWFISCGRVTHLANNELTYAVWVVWEPARSPRESPGARRLFAMRLVR